MSNFQKLFPDNRHDGESDLRKTQLVMLRILKIVDYICREHNIRYWLDGGTLLGAIRHKGFIPWDDDLDIVMPREDFERFTQMAKEGLPDDLFLQTPATEPGYILHGKPSAKIRDKYSRIVEINVNHCNYHQGIFIDIVPIDKFKQSFWGGQLDRFLKTLYRYLCSFYNAYDTGQKNNKNFFRKIASRLKYALPLKWMLDRYVRILNCRTKRNNSLKDHYLMGYCLEVPWRRIWKLDEIFPLQQVQFEDASFFAPNNWDSVLRQFYGDYMKLPDEDKQRSHHVVEVEVDNRD